MKNLRLSLMLLSLTWLTFSCSDDDPAPDVSQSFSDLEGEYIRLAMMANGNQMMVMNPMSETITSTVNETLSQGEFTRYYVSPTGRYLVSVERGENQTRFFDSGIINHNDHGHENPAQWLGKVVASEIPTHYSATGDDIVLFNDGDGSIVHIEESRLEFNDYQPPVIPVATQHHGAAVRLDNGLFAVTFRDESMEDILPQMVKLVDEQGQVQVDDESVRVGRIHGDASNGRVALFGSTDGLLAAYNDRTLALIPNLEGMNAESGNWIGTVRGHDNLDVFYGWARAQGLFRIDPASQSMTRFYEGDDVKSFFFSEDGTYLILHKTDDEVMVFNAATGSEMTQEVIAIAPDVEYENARKEAPTELERLRLMEEPERVLSASSEFLYVLEPSQTEVNILRLSDLSSVKTLTLDSPVDVIMRVGFHRKENVAF
ncbi:MAG: WD40 repeat domain-containing protein [Bacteroidota bacterium]